MRVAAAFLCDAASVRQGLLSVLGGGVTILRRQSFPAPLGITLVYMPEVDADEMSRTYNFTIDVHAVDDPKPLAHIEGGWQADASDLTDPTLSNYAPIVVPLDQVALAKPGYYTVAIDLKGVETRSITFRADFTPAGVDS